jgi:hypothetical protein
VSEVPAYGGHGGAESCRSRSAHLHRFFADDERGHAAHFNELGAALEQARLLLGLPGIGYPRLSLQVQSEMWITDVTAIHGGVQ